MTSVLSERYYGESVFEDWPFSTEVEARMSLLDRAAHGLKWRFRYYSSQAPAKLHLHAQGILADLHRFQAARPSDAFPPCQFSDYWFLYRMVRKRRPAVIWEFGSGNSTVVLARALRDNGAGILFSLDAVETWAASTTAAMPAEFRPFCQVLHSPAEEVTFRGVLGFRHSRLPARWPNFVHLDGPPLTAERQVAVDLVEIEAQLPNDFFLVVDDRKANTRFLREHFRRRYAFSPRPWQAQPVFRLLK